MSRLARLDVLKELPGSRNFNFGWKAGLMRSGFHVQEENVYGGGTRKPIPELPRA
jgi:hypothetical protein